MANGLGRRLAGAVLQGTGAGILQQAHERRQDTLLRIRRQWQKEDRAEDRAHAIEDRDYSEDRADKRTAANQPLTTVFNPETGRNEYAQRSDAIGMEPGRQPGAKRPTAKGADGYLYYTDTRERVFPGVTKDEEDKLVTVSKDPLTGEITHALESEVIAGLKGQGGAAPPSPEEEQALMDRAEAAFGNLGPEWNESFDWINPFVDSDEKAAGASKEEFVQRLAQLIKQNPTVPDDELARRLAAELTGGQQGGQGERGGQDQATAAAGEDQQPPAGYPPNARRAPDGKWYVPDPDRPGGWMLFTP